MDQLPISLVSNDLKYAMSSLKIKTFQKARQYYYTKQQGLRNGQINPQQNAGITDKLAKIQKYLQKYNAVKQDVRQKINFCHIEEIDDQLQFRQNQHKRKPMERQYEQSDDQEPQMVQNLQRIQSMQIAQSDKPQMPIQQSLINQHVQNVKINNEQIKPARQSQFIVIQQTIALGRKYPPANSNTIQPIKNEHNISKLQNSFSNSSYSGMSFDFSGQFPKQKDQRPIKQQWSQTQSMNSKTQTINESQRQSISRTSQSSVNNNNNEIKYQNLFSQSIHDNSIVQIYGHKGIGKTALLMYFCQKYAQKSNRKIYFVNCAGGMTYKRFQRLSKNCPSLQYRDAYILDHVLSVCKNAANDPQTGCIAVDSLTNLLMEQQKTLIFLIKLFKIFSSVLPKGCKVVLTNYIQQSFDHKEQDILTNHYSYYCTVTSEFLKYKYFVKKYPKSDKVLIKMVRGGFIEGEYDVGPDGVNSLAIKEQQIVF